MVNLDRSSNKTKTSFSFASNTKRDILSLLTLTFSCSDSMPIQQPLRFAYENLLSALAGTATYQGQFLCMVFYPSRHPEFMSWFSWDNIALLCSDFRHSSQIISGSPSAPILIVPSFAPVQSPQQIQKSKFAINLYLCIFHNLSQ